MSHSMVLCINHGKSLPLLRKETRTAVKFIIGLILIYFIYRFFIKRQRNLDPHHNNEAKMGEYIDYEEIKDDEYKNT